MTSGYIRFFATRKSGLPARQEEDVGEREALSRSGARKKPVESLLEGPKHFGIVIDIGAGVIGAGFGNL